MEHQGQTEAKFPLNSVTPKISFEDFLVIEYNNIAQAHHNTVNSISAFFRNYILIMSLPVTAAVIFLGQGEGSFSLVDTIFLENPEGIPIFFGFIWFIGLMVLGYIINLRCDALLYARTVNGIRKYFSEHSNLKILEGSRYIVLPTSPHTPPYLELGYFGFVVATFALIGSGYALVGSYTFYYFKVWSTDIIFWTIIITSFLVPFLLYLFLTSSRETTYLRGFIIGVDIDGVLNDHRRFCRKQCF